MRPAAVPTVAGVLPLLLAVVSVAGCSHPGGRWSPTPEMLTQAAPDSFVVAFDTSEGTFEVTMLREWSPLGVDRAYHLVSNDFYAGARIYRVEAGFVSQFGYTGQPAVDSVWLERNIPDEPTVASNLKGTVSFARAGPRTRSFQLFINLRDNSRLDAFVAGGVEGYPPIGRIDSGLDVTEGFYAAYRPDPPQQDSIQKLGNDYLRRNYPQLDSIVGTRVVREWAAEPAGR